MRLHRYGTTPRSPLSSDIVEFRVPAVSELGGIAQTGHWADRQSSTLQFSKSRRQRASLSIHQPIRLG